MPTKNRMVLREIIGKVAISLGFVQLMKLVKSKMRTNNVFSV